MKQFEIFRSGTHTTAKGTTLSFSEGDVAAIAASYDPQLHEAPIVVGHPKQNLPAYGWIKSLQVRAGALVAVPDQVETQFSEMVQDGRFKKVSAALYSPTDKGNPTPGHYYLRHVGFLGAEPPAVKGLKPIEFSEGDEPAILEIEFSEYRTAWAFDNVARLFRGIREFFIETKDLETAEKLVPAWDLDQIAQAASDIRADARIEEARPSFSETQPQDTTVTKTMEQQIADLAAREAALNARETEISAKETTFSESQSRTRAAEDATFVAGLVADGRLPVGLKDAATAIFSELDESELIFSEGNEEVKTTGRAALRDLLSKIPRPVVTGELATGDGPDFSDPEHVAAAITSEIANAKVKGEEISHATALARLKNRR